MNVNSPCRVNLNICKSNVIIYELVYRNYIQFIFDIPK